MRTRMLLIVALLMAQQCRAASVPWTIEGKAVTCQAGACVEVPSGAVALSPAPTPPYELRFEALVPEASEDLPDFGTPQVWFSVSYQGPQDQLAFALRGGRLQDAAAFDFAQRGWVGAASEKMFARDNQSFAMRARRLPERGNHPISPDKWVAVAVRVDSGIAELWVGGQRVFSIEHKYTGKGSLALGGSWHANTFRNIEVRQLPPNSIALAPAAASAAEELAALENRRQTARAAYKPITLPQAPQTGVAELSLDGQWLFMPDGGVESQGAPDPKMEDAQWHLLPVPAFWNPVGWWIFGQGGRHCSRAFFYEELDRCEAFTFDWRKTSAGWYRNHLMVPANYAGKRVSLEFDGVASVCDVFLNGVHVGGSMGMFKPFSVELTPHLRPGENNLLAIRVANGEAKGPKGKGTAGTAVTMTVSEEMVTELPRGIYGNPSEDNVPVARRQGGIWQSVRLRVGGEARLVEVWPQTKGKNLAVTVSAEPGSERIENLELRLRLADKDGKPVATKSYAWPMIAAANGRVEFPELPVALWSPESPNLYNLELELVKKNAVLDSRRMQIGFRDFVIREGKFELNGKPWRFLGANMPPHGLRPQDKELARKFIGFMREGNQRALRAVCSPFPSEWLDETDRQGVAVSYEGQWPWVLFENQPLPDESALKVWKEEWIALVKANRHRPSIVMWTLSNENYSLRDENPERCQRKWDIWQDIMRATRDADPSRPVVIWSGHTRANMTEKLALVSGDKDDGDIDDRHSYAGTYQTSTLFGPEAFWKRFVEEFKVPDRPLLSQEGGTAYADTDLGHQEASYLQTWHGQIWTGRQSYPYASPEFFLSRTARITKEQLESARRANVQGWLAFCNATWYNNVERADLIRPFPAHEAVRLALQPRLVAVAQAPQRLSEGEPVSLKVFAVNDAETSLGGEWVTEVTLESLEGRPLGAPSRIVLKEPALGGGVSEGTVEITPAQTKIAKRTNAVLVLVARDAQGRQISRNRYEVALFPKLPAEPMQVVEVRGSTAAEWTPRIQKLGISAGESKVVLALAPGKVEWNELISMAQAGRRVLVLDPQDLPDSEILGGAVLTPGSWRGEVAEVTEAGRNLGLCAGLMPEDIAWWQGLDRQRIVYRKALTFSKPLSEAIEPWVDHTPPHGYGAKWAMDFPVVRFPVGAGEIVVSTLDFAATERDPATGVFLRNLVQAMHSALDKDMCDLGVSEWSERANIEPDGSVWKERGCKAAEPGL